MMTRRQLILGASALGVSTRTRPALAAHTGTTIGAIRWDAWYEPSYGTERMDAEVALGPAVYQGRAPACASVVDAKTISMAACGTQAQMDAEITAAHGAGIDYWAFCFYGTGAYTSLSMGWQLYQSSTLKAQMNWCMIYGYGLFISQAASMLSTLTGLLAQSSYQRVTVSSVSRPLLYLLNDGTATSTLAATITTFRAACVSAGLPTPYIVILLGGVAPAGAVAATGADAVDNYAYAPAVIAGSYPALVTAAEAEWTTLAASGQQVVPTAMTGWDRRPRVEHPDHAEASYQSPYVGWSQYYAAGTPAQIAAHVGDMITWLKANTSAAPAQTGLIYSWDEHDEGGSTLNPSLGGGSAILTAVGGAL
jgi:hypothetical protein